MRLVLVLVLDGLLAGALLRPLVPPVVHPVAPPLTRIRALGDHPIGGDGPPPSATWRIALDRTVRAVGTPAQRAEIAQLRPPAPPPGDGRLRIQADALAIGGLLGPDRVERILARKETLGDLYGEGLVWNQIAR